MKVAVNYRQKTKFAVSCEHRVRRAVQFIAVWQLELGGETMSRRFFLAIFTSLTIVGLLKIHSPSFYYPEGVFLGPVCDYVIAPVARYAGVWGIPVLTAGGQAPAFQYKTEGQFSSLTRLMGSYSAVGLALKSMLKQFGWTVAGLLYHNHRVGSARGNSLCHFALAAVFTALNSTPAHRSFDQEATEPGQYRHLLEDVARSARIGIYE
ncbi:hypothetical protein B566_EDAN002887 [Ephemera danica]|nr:hypothetical protein B566_EDAN002887 [Ephemera danica]